MAPFPNPACCQHDGPLDPEKLCRKCRAAWNASHSSLKDQTMNNSHLELPEYGTTFVVNGQTMPLPEHMPWLREDDDAEEKVSMVENAQREGVGIDNALPLPVAE